MTESARTTRITAWLDAMGARRAGAPPLASSPFNTLLRAATSALAADTPVLSDAVLAGSIEEDILARSKKLKTMIDQGEMDAGLDYFKNSPADGCTSIIDLARISSGYNPAQASAADSLNRFTLFATAIVEAPVFEQRLLDVRPLHWNAASWQASVKKVLAEFPHIDGADAGRIRASVERLARSAAGHPGKAQSGALYVQNVLYADQKNYEVYLYYAYASFREVHEKKKDPKFVSELKLARAQLSFLTASWSEFAEAVWNKHVCAVVDWLEDNACKTDQVPTALCFDN
jgi:hypothetical protein